MNGIQNMGAFGAAVLFLLAAAVKVGSALRSPGRRRELMRQGILYCLAGLMWVLVAFRFRT
jgi:hypothetical protein